MEVDNLLEEHDYIHKVYYIYYVYNSILTKEALQNIMNDRQDWRRHINRICS